MFSSYFMSSHLHIIIMVKVMRTWGAVRVEGSKLRIFVQTQSTPPIDAKHVHIGYYKYNYMHETIQKKLCTNGLTSYFLKSIDGHGVMEHKIANK